jgi:hypothetical protein
MYLCPEASLCMVLVMTSLAVAGEPPKDHLSNSIGTKDQLDLVMPGARPETDDSYLCSSFEVEKMTGSKDSVHITGFVPDADANRAHHMLLYTCNKPNKLPGTVYDCMHHAMCGDGNTIMFAWAKNAPPTTLPKNVGFNLDPKERKYLVLQVHYAHSLPDADYTGLSLKYQMSPPMYQAGILLMATYGVIPPHEEKVHLDINCKLPADVPLNFFGFRTHAHSLGSVISGYAFNEKSNQYRQIAKGSPQWPQAFYPMKQLQTVKPGEYMTARCTYNSTTRDKITRIGSTAGDEMCNLYLMYFFPPGKASSFISCGGEQAGHEITEGLPPGNDDAPPRNEVWEAKAQNSNVESGVNAINYETMMPDAMANKASTKKAGPEEEDQMATLNFTMPGAKPSEKDDYLCTSMAMKGLSTRKLYIERFTALASGNRAHHMILSKCKHPVKEGVREIYDCRHHAMCLDQSKIMFAWAKHAEPTKLPQDVAFDIEEDDFMVLQVHYAEPLSDADHSGLQLQFTTRQPKYTAGIFLLGVGTLHIPPNTPSTHGDANCKANIPSFIHVFAYRTHAHSYGNVISGYKKSKSSGEWSFIAKGNPQWPQAFYPMKKEVIIVPGDTVAARCSYNTTGHDSPVKIGATSGDEMCNLYLMYYTTSKTTDFVVCFGEDDPELNKHLPEGNDEPLPPNPELEMKAHGTTQPALPTPGRQGKSLPGSHYSVVADWPAKDTASFLGQVSGIAIDVYGNAVIFHRGDRTWNGNTFKSDNSYGMDKNVPIPQDTVLTVNSSGHIINKWGNNFFFLPHMITIDSQNNVWMTDVALQQVFKFGPYGGDNKKPLLTLGTRFEPGTDDSHYCKPTSVAVSQDTKTFYVADGYCNSRIIKYSITVTSDGKHAVIKITEWGKTAGVMSISRGPYNFNVPHSLALAEDKNLICVADRENGRVLCFDTDGNAKKEIQPEGFGSRIFGISYAKEQLYAVSGPEFNPFAPKPVGYILDIESGGIDGTFQVPDGLKNPHDVAVSSDASTIYIIELNPFVTWKLSNGQPSTSGSGPITTGANPNAGGKPPAADSSSSPQQMIIDGAKKLVPTSSGVLWAAVISVPLTILIACLLAIRKCRKRGKGTMGDGNRPKNWGMGDLLGRSKDGFQPVNTEERDGLVGADSDSEVEEFSVPALHA